MTELPIPAPTPEPPPPAAADLVPEPDLSLDLCLIYGIYRREAITPGDGVKALFEAKDYGVSSEQIDPVERPIYEMMEDFARRLRRIPTLTELRAGIGRALTPPSEPCDIRLFAEKIAANHLQNKLKNSVGEIVKLIAKDPYAARESLRGLVAGTRGLDVGTVAFNSPRGAADIWETYCKVRDRGTGLLGLSSPWDAIDKSSRGLQNGELTVLLAKRKCGKCAAQDTLVHDARTGRERTIAELVRSGGELWTWQQGGPISATTPTEYVDCGVMPCLRVVWRSGREMVAAPTHPLLTPGGYVQLGLLKPGRHTAAVRRLPAPLDPVPMPEHEIKILAYMIADGGCTKESTPTYTKLDEDLVSDLEAALGQIDCRLTPSSQPGNYYVVKTESCQMWRSPIVELLQQHGLVGKKSVEKTIPDAVFSLPDEQLGLFLGRLWSGDGSVETSGVVSYSTGSRRMILQVQHLLLRFGVTSRVRTKPVMTPSGERDYYEICLHKETIDSFKANVRLIGEKARRLSSVSFQGRSRVGWIRNDELRDAIRAEMNAKPELLPAVGRRLGYKFAFQRGHVFDSKSGRIRRHIFSAFCSVYESPLRWVLDENITWDEIESISPAGEHHCYDLVVEPTACFVANDYVVHNSWLLLKWFLHILEHDLKDGECLLVVSMEMPRRQIFRRLGAIALKLDYQKFCDGKLSPADEARLDAWVQLHTTHDPTRKRLEIAGPKQVRNTGDIADLCAVLNPRAVAIDGFYIMGSDNRGMWERTLKNISDIKLNLCDELDLPVLATTQLSGSTDKNVLYATGDDAAYAKAIGDFADAMRYLFVNDEYEAKGRRVFRGGESREFRSVDIVINFDLSTQNYDQIKLIPKGEEEPSPLGDWETAPAATTPPAIPASYAAPPPLPPVPKPGEDTTEEAIGF